MNVVITLLLALLGSFGSGQINKNNYGPYIPHWDTFNVCKGPKAGDCGKYQISEYSNMSDVVFTFDFEKDCPISTARVTVSALQGNNKTKKLFNYALDKPCQHFVLGPILISSFNLSNNCKVSKGHYDIHLNMMAKTKLFLGPNFFYGTYEFKVMAHNKANNFLCVVSIIDIQKNASQIITP